MTDKILGRSINDYLCTGCGTCISICPKKAINLSINEKTGLYVREIDKVLCNSCDKCKAICGIEKWESKNLKENLESDGNYDIYLGNYINCYLGYSNHFEVRKNCSSGGIGTELLTYALERKIIDGAIVTKMKKNKPLEPEPFIARSKEDIYEARGSKYCPVPLNVLLKEIVDDKKKYAIVGLPCHINSLNRAEYIFPKIQDKIILRLGLFCSGVPNFKATQYLLSKLNISASCIDQLKYRGSGWPGSFSIHFKNGELKSIPYPGYWSGFGEFFFMPRCNSCINWFSPLADVSLGDAWLPEIKASDSLGTSIIISRSKKADEILHHMANENYISLKKIDADKVIESQKGYINKGKRIMAQRTLSKLIEKNNYASISDIAVKNQFPKLTWMDYTNKCWFDIGSFLASKEPLWGLLDIYCATIKKLSFIIR